MSTLMPSIYARHPSQYQCMLQLAQLLLLVLYPVVCKDGIYCMESFHCAR